MDNKQKIDLSLVVPCYNEAPHLKTSVQQVFKTLKNITWNWEIIFVDDKSVDQTREIIDQIIQENPEIKIKKIIHPQNTGRGRAVADGIKIAEGEIVGFIDIDLEVSPVYIPEFCRRILEGADMAIGQRIYTSHWHSIGRNIVSRGYSKLIRFLFKLPFKDTEAGYKFFRRSKIFSLLDEIRDPHWFWDTECVIRSHIRGLKIVETPVLFIRRFDKKSTVRVFQDSLDYVKKLSKFYYKIKTQIK